RLRPRGGRADEARNFRSIRPGRRRGYGRDLAHDTRAGRDGVEDQRGPGAGQADSVHPGRCYGRNGRQVTAAIGEGCPVIAIRLYSRGGSGGMVAEIAPAPRPGEGEVLVRVHAAGVIPTELSWVPTWTMRTGEPRPLPVIPGHEFSGAIAALGSGVKDVGVGDLVYGLNDWYRDGASAEYCVPPA